MTSLPAGSSSNGKSPVGSLKKLYKEKRDYNLFQSNSLESHYLCKLFFVSERS